MAPGGFRALDVWVSARLVPGLVSVQTPEQGHRRGWERACPDALFPGEVALLVLRSEARQRVWATAQPRTLSSWQKSVWLKSSGLRRRRRGPLKLDLLRGTRTHAVPSGHSGGRSPGVTCTCTCTGCGGQQGAAAVPGEECCAPWAAQPETVSCRAHGHESGRGAVSPRVSPPVSLAGGGRLVAW